MSQEPGSRPATAGPPVEPGSSLPISIPDHQLLRCIGRGSYGEVWLARNLMGGYRAVKIVNRRSFKNQRPFEREFSGICKFEPISRLHEGFVDVLHVGTSEARDCVYYVMELGDDQTSGQVIDPSTYAPKTLASEIARQGSLPLQETLQLGLALSHALSVLHHHGLVHRDIKPSNIIYVQGAPKLADIGLVTGVNDALSWVGTAGFIPPEGPGTTQADIYSLGKVLYEASTGKDRQDFPALPTSLDTSPEHVGLLELNEVVIRACHNEPARRYATAWEMHAELTAIANGKSLRRLRVLERRWTNLKRSLAVAGALAAVLALLVYEGYRGWKTRHDQHQQQVGANVAYGNNALEAGDLLGALPYFAEVLRLEPRSGAALTHRLRIGSVLTQCPKLTHMWFESKQINSGRFSPDGARVLLAELFGQARIYDLKTGQLYSHPFGPSQGLSSACYSPDGRFILTASQNSTAAVWEAETLREIRCFEHPDRVYSATFTPDGLQIVTCCKDGKARLWDLQTGDLNRIISTHPGPVAFAAFSRDGQLLVTCGRDGTAQVHDWKSGQLRMPPVKHGRWVNHACFSPDNSKLLTASDDHRVRLWEVPSGRPLLPELLHQDVVRSVEFSPDGKVIATASLDRTVRLWSAENLHPLGCNSVLRHRERVTQASFSPDGRCLLVCCVDGSARIWDLSRGSAPPEAREPQYNPLDHGKFASSISVQILGGKTNCLVGIWDTVTGKQTARIVIPGLLNAARLSTDGTRLLACAGKVARLWDVNAGKPLTKPLIHEADVTCAEITRDLRRLVTASGNQVFLWNAETATPLFPPLVHSVPVRYVEFSPDERSVVTCCADVLFTKCYAQIWDAQTGRPIGPPLPHADGVLWVAFSPDGTRVVTASEDSTAIVWDTGSGKPLGPPLKHSDQVQAARFSPDGKWIVTASLDKTARVWSADTMDPLTPPFRHLHGLFGAAFSPNGRGIMTTDTRRTWFWNLPVEDRPVEDILEVVRLLSGGPGSPAPEKQLWSRLQGKVADFRSASARQIAAWHDFQAQECELEERWIGAAFHLRRLYELKPQDQTVAERLGRAQQHLQ